MAWLNLNGVEIVASETAGASDPPREIGGASEEAFDGTMRQTRLATKRDITCETTPMTIEDALAVDGLVRGLGHVWSFESSVYSSKGLGPAAGGAIIRETGIFQKYGNARAKVQGLTEYDVGLDARYTLLAWKLNAQGDAFDHWALLDTGTWYKNGSVHAAPSPLWGNVGSGAVFLEAEFNIQIGRAHV